MSEQWEPGLARELRDTLVRHAEEGSGRPTDLATVQGRAQRIRRNRRAAVAAGLVAVVAIAAPLAVAGLGQLRADGPQVTQTPHSALNIPYLRGSTLVLPDGTVRELPQRFQEGAVVHGYLYGVYGTEETGGNRLIVVHPNGAAEHYVDIGSQLASNADGSVVAWAEENGDLVVHSSDGTFGMEAPRYFLPHGIMGDQTCAAKGTCLVYGDVVNEGRVVGQDLGSYLTPKSVSLTDMTANGLVARVTRRTATGPCSSVYDSNAGRDTFTTCDRDLYKFSADGQYVSAAHTDYAGTGEKTDVSILDSGNGSAVATFTASAGQRIFDSAWDDVGHLLVQVHDQDGWSVVRLGVDGSRKVVLGPYDSGEELVPGYTFLAGS